ncbi:hypothetical protein P692DRAFT_20871190 [Suillus brevipes Sb2]|nr:hypothetical protein P692DRAFT_20871190 [Suillus brevipes Sb2]
MHQFPTEASDEGTVSLCPEGHTDRAAYLNNLVYSLGVHRFDHQGAGDFVLKFAPPTRAITTSYAPHKPIPASDTIPATGAIITPRSDGGSYGDSSGGSQGSVPQIGGGYHMDASVTMAATSTMDGGMGGMQTSMAMPRLVASPACATTINLILQLHMGTTSEYISLQVDAQTIPLQQFPHTACDPPHLLSQSPTYPPALPPGGRAS